MISLLGVDHRIQSNFDFAPQFLRDWFVAAVKEIVEEEKIDVIAEEYSVDAAPNKMSTLAEAASEIGLTHRYCDPGISERKSRGILLPTEYKNSLDKRNSDLQREQYWFDQIKDLQIKNILFVCGCCHVNSFKLLLEEYGLPVHVLSNHWDYDELIKRWSSK